jgi:hypothetical protein
MALDADMRRKIGVSLGATILFVAILLWAGIQFGAEADGGGVEFQSPGGAIMVGTVTLFVLLMAAVGVYLDRQ